MLTILLAALTAAHAQDVEAGKAVFQSNCAACHGDKGDGKGPAAMALLPPPTDFTAAAFWAGRDDTALKTVIKVGKPGTSMAGFATLSDDDIANLIAYLKTLKAD